MITQIAIMIFGASAIWFVGRKEKWKRWGYILGLLGQPFWIYESYTNEQWGILIMCLFYAYSWIQGILNYWLVDDNETGVPKYENPPPPPEKNYRFDVDEARNVIKDLVYTKNYQYAREKALKWLDLEDENFHKRINSSIELIEKELKAKKVEIPDFPANRMPRTLTMKNAKKAEELMENLKKND